MDLKRSITLPFLHPDSLCFRGTFFSLSHWAAPFLHDSSPGFKLSLYQIQTLKQPVGHYMNCNWTLGQSFSALTWAKNCREPVESSDTFITGRVSEKHPTNTNTARLKRCWKMLCNRNNFICPCLSSALSAWHEPQSGYWLNHHITVSSLIKWV